MLHLQIGTLIYVQVVKANPGMNPELSCTDASGIAAEFGGLKDGYMFPCTMGLSRMLLNSPTCPVLDGLGQVWVNATSPHTTILVANEIMNSETLSGTQQRIMGEKLLQRIQ
ncbi:hypothetical protein AAZX31_19G039900 [Glycine max]|uniref:Uncharacterized protein n=2 Tax=Glycine subgen. Soja TaxID=1462606 RepID=A0A0R0EHX7_SOYBN|nr:hypothetical protein JHK86_052334 [Glycine max]KAG5082338.1 hypothetical protein JHK84_052376 [Glycine max]KRG93835.1 hypothetical protein GLYMA_19G045000v4 [Glycine max]RZB46436.1 putative exosome complex component rrp40 isoform A [Glycine soja]